MSIYYFSIHSAYVIIQEIFFSRQIVNEVILNFHLLSFQVAGYLKHLTISLQMNHTILTFDSIKSRNKANVFSW